MTRGGARKNSGANSNARAVFGESSKILRLRVPEPLHSALADYAKSCGSTASATTKEALLKEIPKEFLDKHKKSVDSV